MTVAELIEKLTALPPDLPVYGSDYEDGLYEITDASVQEEWKFSPFHPERVELS